MSDIDTLLSETRSFNPPEAFAQRAMISEDEAYQELWEASQTDPVSYWERAAEEIEWFEPWTQALDWKAPFSRWFVGGKTNAAYNCLDRHVNAGRGNQTALIWEGEDGSVETISYQALLDRVCQLSNALEKNLDLKAGDTVAIYLPLIPEAVAAMLACARIGATHSVIFAGFSSQAISDRVQDAQCKAVLTADIGYRKGKKLELGRIVEQAVEKLDCVKNVLVLNRETDFTSNDPRYLDWRTTVESQPTEHKAAELDSEHPLFFLYTSGTTGKPKGIVHSTGGYLTGVTRSAKWVFDLKEEDVYWCTADVGWITGHSYLVYGILSNGNTALIYEGAPMHPHAGRFWEIIDKHQVSILYTAPTAIRAFMREGDGHPNQFKLDSLRLLGTVGEPINPEAWMWYHTVIGKKRCPIVDTWWQTETGNIMISPIPGVTTTHPGSASRPLPGIVADVVNEQGESCEPGQGGYLVVKHPWPSMIRTIHNNPERFKETYWNQFPGIYFTGDGAHKDTDGNFWIKGRLDDVINVSGHRLGTMEVESALVSHASVAEAAVVGRPDDLKGQAIVAYIIPTEGTDLSPGSSEALKKTLSQHVTSEIGALARPEEIHITKALPKTRSGKIMRRLLRDKAAGRAFSGDTTSLDIG